MGELTCLEICAGAGGQSLGLEQAGFTHEAAVELDPDACETLLLNRGYEWKIIEDDVHNVDGRAFSGVDLLSGGVPCPPFSIAGKQLGQEDDRDLFPQALRLVAEISPRAVLLENVRGLATRRFDIYRAQVLEQRQAARAVGHRQLHGGDARIGDELRMQLGEVFDQKKNDAVVLVERRQRRPAL